VPGPNGPAASPNGPAASPGGPAAPSTLTVVAAGDLFVPPLLTRQAAADAAAAGRPGHDFTQILAAVTPVIADADLAICHLEQPLAEPAGPFPSYPFFAAPPQLADAIAAAGFDACSTASNHSLDGGMDGVVRTLDHLDRVGVAHTGTARSAREAATPTIVDVRGVPVGHLSYTFSLNGIPLPEGRPWAANLIDADAILAEARRARDGGAEIVIASLHWGTEYQVAADPGQVALAEELLAAPELDLIVGHHVHVVQPFELIGSKWVAYGMGNLTTRFPDGSAEQTQDSVLPRFTFERTSPGRWQVTEVEVVAAWMEYRPAARVVNLPAALADPDLPPDRRARYERALERITDHVMRRGAGAGGLLMVPPADVAGTGTSREPAPGAPAGPSQLAQDTFFNASRTDRPARRDWWAATKPRTPAGSILAYSRNAHPIALRTKKSECPACAEQ
jgi:hypothetical protein